MIDLKELREKAEKARRVEAEEALRYIRDNRMPDYYMIQAASVHLKKYEVKP